MPPNYYIILGVPSSATETDIKAAYRRLAKELHPDYYGEEHAPFQILQEAYSVLSNPESRKSYDYSLQDVSRNQQPQPSPPARRYSDDTIEPLVPDRGRGSFSGSFSNQPFHNFWSGFDSLYDNFSAHCRRSRQPENRSRDNVTVEITLSREQAQNGGNVQLKVPLQRYCPSCSGFGYLRHNCRRCNSAGFVSGETTVTFSFPAGIRANQALHFSLRAYNARPTNLTAIFQIR